MKSHPLKMLYLKDKVSKNHLLKKASNSHPKMIKLQVMPLLTKVELMVQPNKLLQKTDSSKKWRNRLPVLKLLKTSKIWVKVKTWPRNMNSSVTKTLSKPTFLRRCSKKVENFTESTTQLLSLTNIPEIPVAVSRKVKKVKTSIKTVTRSTNQLVYNILLVMPLLDVFKVMLLPVKVTVLLPKVTVLLKEMVPTKEVKPLQLRKMKILIVDRSLS